MEKGQDREQEKVLRMAAEIGARTAIEIYEKEKLKEKKQHLDRRLKNTKLLLNNYQAIKLHAADAVASLRGTDEDIQDFFSDFVDKDEFQVAAIMRSQARSAIMLSHIDVMLHNYELICAVSPRPEDMRRFRVLQAKCLLEKPLTAQEIANRENIDVRTVYKDFDLACEKMSALLFGIQWLSKE